MKRALSWLLSLALVLQLAPAAFAEEIPAPETEPPVAEETTGGAQLLEETAEPYVIHINFADYAFFPDGSFTVNNLEGELPQGVSFDYENRTLTLSGATLDHLAFSQTAISVELVGENTITPSADYLSLELTSGAWMEFVGSGTLNMGAAYVWDGSTLNVSGPVTVNVTPALPAEVPEADADYHLDGIIVEEGSLFVYDGHLNVDLTHARNEALSTEEDCTYYVDGIRVSEGGYLSLAGGETTAMVCRGNAVNVCGGGRLSQLNGTLTAGSSQQTNDSTGLNVEGSATISGGQTNLSGRLALGVAGDVALSGGHINATTIESFYNWGLICVTGSMVVRSGTLDIDSVGSNGICVAGEGSGGYFEQSGGTITMDIVYADSQSFPYDWLHGISQETGEVVISGGSMTIHAPTSGMNLFGATSITGGSVYAEADIVGIWVCNPDATLRVSGGNVTAVTPLSEGYTVGPGASAGLQLEGGAVGRFTGGTMTLTGDNALCIFASSNLTETPDEAWDDLCILGEGVTMTAGTGTAVTDMAYGNTQYEGEGPDGPVTIYQHIYWPTEDNTAEGLNIQTLTIAPGEVQEQPQVEGHGFSINGQWLVFTQDGSDAPALPQGVSYDYATQTLYLNGAELESLGLDYSWYDEATDTSGVNFSHPAVTIVLEGENTIYSDGATALSIGSGLDLTITGTGYVSVTAHTNPDDENPSSAIGLWGGSSLTITGSAQVCAQATGTFTSTWTDETTGETGTDVDRLYAVSADWSTVTPIRVSGNGRLEAYSPFSGVSAGHLVLEDNGAINTNQMFINMAPELDQRPLLQLNDHANITVDASAALESDSGNIVQDHALHLLNDASVEINGGSLVVTTEFSDGGQRTGEYSGMAGSDDESIPGVPSFYIGYGQFIVCTHDNLAVELWGYDFTQTGGEVDVCAYDANGNSGSVAMQFSGTYTMEGGSAHYNGHSRGFQGLYSTITINDGEFGAHSNMDDTGATNMGAYLYMCELAVNGGRHSFDAPTSTSEEGAENYGLWVHWGSANFSGGFSHFSGSTAPIFHSLYNQETFVSALTLGDGMLMTDDHTGRVMTFKAEEGSVDEEDGSVTTYCQWWPVYGENSTTTDLSINDATENQNGDEAVFDINFYQDDVLCKFSYHVDMFGNVTGVWGERGEEGIGGEALDLPAGVSYYYDADENMMYLTLSDAHLVGLGMNYHWFTWVDDQPVLGGTNLPCDNLTIVLEGENTIHSDTPDGLMLGGDMAVTFTGDGSLDVSIDADHCLEQTWDWGNALNLQPNTDLIFSGNVTFTASILSENPADLSGGFNPVSNYGGSLTVEENATVTFSAPQGAYLDNFGGINFPQVFIRGGKLQATHMGLHGDSENRAVLDITGGQLVLSGLPSRYDEEGNAWGESLNASCADITISGGKLTIDNTRINPDTYPDTYANTHFSTINLGGQWIEEGDYHVDGSTFTMTGGEVNITTNQANGINVGFGEGDKTTFTQSGGTLTINGNGDLFDNTCINVGRDASATFSGGTTTLTGRRGLNILGSAVIRDQADITVDSWAVYDETSGGADYGAVRLDWTYADPLSTLYVYGGKLTVHSHNMGAAMHLGGHYTQTGGDVVLSATYDENYPGYPDGYGEFPRPRGIEADEHITISGGTLTIDAVSAGINAFDYNGEGAPHNSGVDISGTARVTITGVSLGMNVNSPMNISGRAQVDITARSMGMQLFNTTTFSDSSRVKAEVTLEGLTEEDMLYSMIMGINVVNGAQLLINGGEHFISGGTTESGETTAGIFTHISNLGEPSVLLNGGVIHAVGDVALQGSYLNFHSDGSGVVQPSIAIGEGMHMVSTATQRELEYVCLSNLDIPVSDEEGNTTDTVDQYIYFLEEDNTLGNDEEGYDYATDVLISSTSGAIVDEGGQALYDGSMELISSDITAMAPAAIQVLITGTGSTTITLPQGVELISGTLSVNGDSAPSLTDIPVEGSALISFKVKGTSGKHTISARTTIDGQIFTETLELNVGDFKVSMGTLTTTGSVVSVGRGTPGDTVTFAVEGGQTVTTTVTSLGTFYKDVPIPAGTHKVTVTIGSAVRVFEVTATSSGLAPSVKQLTVTNFIHDAQGAVVENNLVVDYDPNGNGTGQRTFYTYWPGQDEFIFVVTFDVPDDINIYNAEVVVHFDSDPENDITVDLDWDWTKQHWTGKDKFPKPPRGYTIKYYYPVTITDTLEITWTSELPVTPIIDPAGVVYSGSLDHPVAGSTVTLYYGGNDANTTPADSEMGIEYDMTPFLQLNPIVTGVDGAYRWDVPQGWWRVKAESPDKKYSTTSAWMYVGSARTDVHMDLDMERKQSEYTVQSIAVTDSQVSVTVSNNTSPHTDDQVVLAWYTGAGQFLGMDSQTLNLKKGASGTFTFDNAHPGAGYVKAFILTSSGTLPLAGSLKRPEE